MNVAEREIDELIMAAVFEERGWPGRAKDARGNLLLQARRLVAVKFGGEIATKAGIDGIPDQFGRPFLTRWVMEGEVQFSHRLTPAAFYAQVRALLRGLGVSEDQINQMITVVVFEERNWPVQAEGAREYLLLQARRLVATSFGGILAQLAQ